jgi:hypothetical protein
VADDLVDDFYTPFVRPLGAVGEQQQAGDRDCAEKASRQK